MLARTSCVMSDMAEKQLAGAGSRTATQSLDLDRSRTRARQEAEKRANLIDQWRAPGCSGAQSAASSPNAELTERAKNWRQTARSRGPLLPAAALPPLLATPLLPSLPTHARPAFRALPVRRSLLPPASPVPLFSLALRVWCWLVGWCLSFVPLVVVLVCCRFEMRVCRFGFGLTSSLLLPPTNLSLVSARHVMMSRLVEE